MEPKHVLIIGGGFAGLNAAKALSNHAEVRVTLVDQRNYHLFQPLLYQVATAGLNPSDIAVPIRAQFSKAKNVEVHLGKVDRIDLKTQQIHGREGSVRYDYLVLACGAQHSYFGNDHWEEFAPGLKTLEQATEMRRRLLSAFEAAENELDPARQARLLTFVVVGGGPTGVELAGAIADISRTVLVKDFKRINPADAKVILIEAGKRVLAQLSESLSERTASDLVHLGVDLRLNQRVTKIDATGVEIGSGHIASECVFWAAGVQAGALSKTLGVALDRAGRITVNPDLAIPGYPNAFVVGDLASLDLGGGIFLPGLAPAAIQTGKYAGQAILREIHGKTRQKFRYVDKGQMATIGKHRAVAETGRLKLTGFIAWMAWLFIHILYLIGFKNRMGVLVDWAWNYLFSKRGARLITSRDWKLDR